ncbi:PEP-CTERM sorting domain-containing protein [Singulisphaera sp. Ch08]|uniref:PEP-CTERM sorting domain-containing protein n=1 Tax=Singulisphaera sp. Ch08 TaxID=3120278 RepID=A0AAU7CKT1_9BACT
MAKLFGVCSLVLVLSATSIANAAVTSYQPNPVDLNDLDHHQVYTWRIDNINLGSNVITAASISIKSIANWDTNPNKLFIHLLDTAKGSGVRSFVDDPSNATPVPTSQIIDDFVNTRYHSQSNWLVAKGTADTFLTSKSFSTTPTDFVYNFTADQLKALNSYVANGKDIALGFDPDCHFFNNGITFKITTAAVPEPSAIVLLGGGIFGLFFRQRALRRRQIGLDSIAAA